MAKCKFNILVLRSIGCACIYAPCANVSMISTQSTNIFDRDVASFKFYHHEFHDTGLKLKVQFIFSRISELIFAKNLRRQFKLKNAYLVMGDDLFVNNSCKVIFDLTFKLFCGLRSLENMIHPMVWKTYQHHILPIVHSRDEYKFERIDIIQIVQTRHHLMSN